MFKKRTRRQKAPCFNEKRQQKASTETIIHFFMRVFWFAPDNAFYLPHQTKRREHAGLWSAIKKIYHRFNCRKFHACAASAASKCTIQTHTYTHKESKNIAWTQSFYCFVILFGPTKLRNFSSRFSVSETKNKQNRNWKCRQWKGINSDHSGDDEKYAAIDIGDVKLHCRSEFNYAL